jgi:hypothetical protein
MKKTKSNIAGISENLSNSINEDIELKQHVISPLDKISVGISVSDSDEYLQMGFSKIHQRDITIELTRYLLLNGAHLVYGGDLRKEGYTNAFSELSFQYRKRNDKNEMLFTNYFAWPIHLDMKLSDEAEYKRNRVIIEKVGCAKEVPLKFRNIFAKPDSLQNKFYLAKSLSKMRHEMVSKCNARIFLGGKTSQYSGFYPGIIEEAYLTLIAKQPTYLIGAFGGATAYVIRALKGEKPQKLADEIAELFPAANEIIDYGKKKKSDYITTKDLFVQMSKIGIKNVIKVNNLNEDENETLFATKHFYEIMYFILLGLNRTFTVK